LLAFYQETFFKIVPIENAVHSAVKGCLIESKRLFLTTLNRQGEYLTQSPVVYPIDLKASHVTRECAIQIKEMLRVVSNSLSSITLEASDSCHIDTVLGRSFLYHRYNIIYLFIIVVIIIFITTIIISTIIVIVIINPISIIIIIVVNAICCILLKASLSSRYYSHVVSELNPYSLQKCLSSCLIMCLCCR